MQVHQNWLYGSPFPNFEQRDTTKTNGVDRKTAARFRAGLAGRTGKPRRADGFDQQAHGRKSFDTIARGAEDQPEYATAFGGELQPPRGSLIQPPQRSDHHGYGRASERLIHRPQRVLFAEWANDDEPLQG